MGRPPATCFFDRLVYYWIEFSQLLPGLATDVSQLEIAEVIQLHCQLKVLELTNLIGLRTDSIFHQGRWSDFMTLPSQLIDYIENRFHCKACRLDRFLLVLG